jgi:Flp pilus assembly protein TadB
MSDASHDTAGHGSSGRSTWALPVGLALLVVGVLGAWLLPNDDATTFTGIFVAVAVVGLVLAVSGVAERFRKLH